MKIYEDLRAVQARLAVMQYLVAAMVGLLLIQFWHLQVVQARHFRELAEKNRTRTLELQAPRGELLDRHGRTLVENRPSFNIVLTPEHSEDLDRAVTRLSAALGIGEGQIRERLARRAPLQPVVVVPDARFEHVAAIEARRLEIPEATVDVVPLRSYPLAAAAAHALGRVGEVTEAQLKRPDFGGLKPGDLVGQAGIEWLYNPRLMGRKGLRRVVVNSRGLEVAETARQPPVEGPSLTLTLDAELQQAMETAFEGRPGSAVALDPETGAVLAMTSIPAYDPNQFTHGIDASLWRELTSDPETPLMNRVIQGQYAPGSLFKVVMAVAALEEGVITPDTTFYCPGYLSIYNTVFRCNRPGGHGRVAVREALALSCNVFFYNVGVRLEIERIASWSTRLGLGRPTGLDLPAEASGLVPSPEWKLRTQHAPWYAGETVSVAIGQGQVTATPLQMARLAATIANGGSLVQPHLVQAVGGQPVAPPGARALGLRAQTLQVVREGMEAVVSRGTAWRARLPGTAVAGKTGSAQVVARARLERSSNEPSLLPHAWFIAFAPVEQPRIALAVLVENGGSGGEAAAPVARRILERFFGSATEPAAQVAD